MRSWLRFGVLGTGGGLGRGQAERQEDQYVVPRKRRSRDDNREFVDSTTNYGVVRLVSRVWMTRPALNNDGAQIILLHRKQGTTTADCARRAGRRVGANPLRPPSESPTHGAASDISVGMNVKLLSLHSSDCVHENSEVFEGTRFLEWRPCCAH